MSYSIDRGEKGYRVRSKRAKVGEEVFDGGFVPVPAFYSASYLIHSFIYSFHAFHSFILFIYHFICSGACWGTKSSCNWSLWCRCPLQRWVAMARYKFPDVWCNIPCPPVFILYGKIYSIKLNSKNKTNWKSYSWMKSLSKNEITPWRQKTLNSLDPYATHLLALETIYRTLTAQAV